MGCNVGDRRSNFGTGERVTMLGSSHAYQHYKIGHTTIIGQSVTKREIKVKEECY